MLQTNMYGDDPYIAHHLVLFFKRMMCGTLADLDRRMSGQQQYCGAESDGFCADDLQDAGVGLAGLSGSKTSLRELSIRGKAGGPYVMASIAGACSYNYAGHSFSDLVRGQPVAVVLGAGRHLGLDVLCNSGKHAHGVQHRQG